MTDIQWFDNHCHLGEDAETVVNRDQLAGVVKLITESNYILAGISRFCLLYRRSSPT